ncbi:hypothetical protein COU18_02835 [Candidatus Kaiserbacteria bacterium CG10_big_fil_rev_8_21_14_0_10_51_14]|uniref:Uncharacterized protein n=1 Tax=Candidatus Kaiserbacteria bacterium CG10_big_fil_rev_8_21_14_0_10_51_14 TaxID=1974610 RepID=A0A2H0UAZ2_9BACT|nr:MAG: hypothetical protein COU18_02835 [Candidatus Kaiserbacteria bacterium CG10_big_fil_rev_8_21_14_0_10_51_14]
MEDPRDKNKGPTRRNVLLGAAALVGVGAAAGISNWMRSDESLGDEDHATNVYMGYQNGTLRKNFEELQAIGKLINATPFREREEKRGIYDEQIKEITDRKNELLKEFDVELIPFLLVAYIKAGHLEKTLVKVYDQLGGNVQKVENGEEGNSGVDLNLITQIRSVMRYSLSTDDKSYGLASHDLLEFRTID